MTVVSRLFDADGTDDVVELDDTVVPRLTDRQLLWVDIHDPDVEELRAVAQILGIERQSVHNLLNPIGRPRLDVLGEYFEVNVFAIDKNDEPLALDFFAGPNWVATVHRETVPFLDDFRDRLGPDTEIGWLTHRRSWRPCSTGTLGPTSALWMIWSEESTCSTSAP